MVSEEPMILVCMTGSYHMKFLKGRVGFACWFLSGRCGGGQDDPGYVCWVRGVVGVENVGNMETDTDNGETR